MTYNDVLRGSAKMTDSIVCMGLDPVIKGLPYNPDSGQRIVDFYGAIFDKMKEEEVFPAAFKPNEGFYAREDSSLEGKFEGSLALAEVMRMIKKGMPHIPIILDNKRGDIGKSSANYASEGFDSWKGDAVTVHPYMGHDSVLPFAKGCNNESHQGVYVLTRTSNPGAKDLQNLMTEYKGETMPIYMVVANQVLEHAIENPGIGSVVGATYPKDLSLIAELFADSGKDVPTLLPGVGSQGASAEDTVKLLLGVGYDPLLARISSSSGVTHPWVKAKEECPKNFDEVVVGNLRGLNEEINQYL